MYSEGGGGGGGGGGDDGESTCTVVHASGISIYCANVPQPMWVENVILHSRLELLEYNVKQQAMFWPVWVAEERRCIQDCLQTLVPIMCT